MRFRLLALGMGLLLALLTNRAPVDYTRSDPYLSLFVSQALLEHRAPWLDPYAGQLDPVLDAYAVREQNGRLTYYFPLAPSLYAAPFVAAAAWFGVDVTDPAGNHRVQRAAAALSCAAIFWLLLALARAYLAPIPALAITAVTVLGSSLTSTLGTALWNLHWSVLFGGMALAVLVADDVALAPSGRDAAAVVGGNRPFPARSAWLLALFWFAAYAARPTAAAFIVAGLIYLAWRDRHAALQVAGLLAGLLLLFAGAHFRLLGDWLPDYYGVVRLDRSYQSGLVFLWHLVSPSRGLLVFSPFLLLVLAGLVAYGRRVGRRPLFWLALGWLASQLWALAHVGHWWGGHGFGPRLLTDAMPAAFLLTVLLWREMAGAPPALRRAGATAFLLLGLVAVAINSGQGLYNPATSRWNARPDVDQHPELLLDWRYPQFLASDRQLELRQQAGEAR